MTRVCLWLGRLENWKCGFRNYKRMVVEEQSQENGHTTACNGVQQRVRELDSSASRPRYEFGSRGVNRRIEASELLSAG
jgi:hypothetical protein